MSRERNREWTRRRVLAAGGAAATVGVAGCTGGTGSDDAANRATTADQETAGSRETTTDAPLGGHPAAVGIGDQPRFGPPPTDAEGVVVAFEDPSCPRCAAFETDTVPKLRERLGDRVSFVFRGYPVIYPWGEPAAHAIETAFARETEAMGMDDGTMDDETVAETKMGDETTAETAGEDAPYGSEQGSVATWALVRHYFENQSEFGEENVLDRTREFLAAETDLDAEAVVSDAEAATYDDAVQADLDAGRSADVGNTTPTVFLFRDGEFRTSANGSISFEVVRSALGL